MPQEFYGSFQDGVEREGASPFPKDEKAGQAADYANPGYYQASEFVPYEHPASTNYRDYTDPSHYSVFPPASNESQESYTPVSVEWNPGDEERGKTQQWQQEKVSNRAGRVRRLAGLGGLFATIGGWLLKLKGLAFLLKFGAAGLTALISVAFYSLAFGWVFAFGFVGLIFIHEMGHVIAVKAKGLPFKGMLFIPFVGAAVAWSNAKNIKDEAEVAIAGPLAGAIGSAICLGVAVLFPVEGTMWLLPLAYIGFFLNLLNLAPVWPLDGGRVFDAINRRVWILGFLGLLGLQIWSWLQGDPSLWLLFLLILSGSRLLSRQQTPNNGAEVNQDGIGTSQNGEGTGQNEAEIVHNPYYKISTSSRITLTVLYFSLVIVLFLGMTIAHSYMPPAI
jgi:Zn-dependent protease